MNEYKDCSITEFIATGVAEFTFNIFKLLQNDDDYDAIGTVDYIIESVRKSAREWDKLVQQYRECIDNPLDSSPTEALNYSLNKAIYQRNKANFIALKFIDLKVVLKNKGKISKHEFDSLRKETIQDINQSWPDNSDTNL